MHGLERRFLGDSQMDQGGSKVDSRSVGRKLRKGLERIDGGVGENSGRVEGLGFRVEGLGMRVEG